MDGQVALDDVAQRGTLARPSSPPGANPRSGVAATTRERSTHKHHVDRGASTRVPPLGASRVRSCPRWLGDVRLGAAHQAAHMEFRILGPLEVVEHGSRLEVGRGKERSVLAILLLHANEVISSERLIDYLWADEPPATAAKSVQVYVSRLRKALASAGSGGSPNGVLLTRGGGYTLRVEPGQFDAESFEQGVTQAERSLAAGAPEGGVGDIAPRARPLARPGARRLRLRAVRRARDRPAAGATAGRDRAAHHRRSAARPPRHGGARARHAGRSAPPARTLLGAAHARPLPQRTPDRGATGIPAGAPRARRGGRPRARRALADARAGDPRARSRARSAARDRRTPSA